VLVFRTPPPRQKFVVRIDMLNIRVDLSTLTAFPAARVVRIHAANGINILATAINTYIVFTLATKSAESYARAANPSCLALVPRYQFDLTSVALPFVTPAYRNRTTAYRTTYKPYSLSVI
jgi:hypothetical protein